MGSHDIAQVDSRPQESYKRLLSKAYPELIVPTFHCYHPESSCHLLSPGKLQSARHCLLALLSLHQISTFQSEWSLRYKSTQFRTLRLLSISIKMKGKALTTMSKTFVILCLPPLLISPPTTCLLTHSASITGLFPLTHQELLLLHSLTCPLPSAWTLPPDSSVTHCLHSMSPLRTLVLKYFDPICQEMFTATQMYNNLRGRQPLECVQPNPKWLPQKRSPCRKAGPTSHAGLPSSLLCAFSLIFLPSNIVLIYLLVSWLPFILPLEWKKLRT